VSFYTRMMCATPLTARLHLSPPKLASKHQHHIALASDETLSGATKLNIR